MIGRSAGGSVGTGDVQGCNKTQERIERADNAAKGALIGGLVEIQPGAAIGSAVSSKDVILIDQNNRDFSGLRGLARYKGGEPEFLREIN